METLSNFLLVGECLLDKRRVDFFAKTIKDNVKKGDIVVDAGTGSGIMALLAARAGAKKVYAIEVDKQIANVAKRNIQVNGYKNIIEVINKDIRNWHLPAKREADVVIMEMLDTGLIAEQQAEAIIQLKRNKIITGDTLLLPGKASFLFEMVDYDFNFCGFIMQFVLQARNFGIDARIKDYFSRSANYAEIDLSTLESMRIDRTIVVRSTNSGTVNAIRLRTRVALGQSWIGATSDMNMPVIVPIKPIKIKVGQQVSVNIMYCMGSGVHDLKVTACIV